MVPAGTYNYILDTFQLIQFHAHISILMYSNVIGSLLMKYRNTDHYFLRID